MYKVGDHVKIFRVNEKSCPVFSFNDHMESLVGRTAKIKEVCKNGVGRVLFYRINLDEGTWKWESGCFEPEYKEWD